VVLLGLVLRPPVRSGSTTAPSSKVLWLSLLVLPLFHNTDDVGFAMHELGAES